MTGSEWAVLAKFGYAFGRFSLNLVTSSKWTELASGRPGGDRISEVRWGALGSDGMFWLVGFYVTLYWISPRQERFGILDKVSGKEDHFPNLLFRDEYFYAEKVGVRPIFHTDILHY